ncbi:MAG: hypothetical protein RI885_2089 [Actinomycetota bacterium]
MTRAGAPPPTARHSVMAVVVGVVVALIAGCAPVGAESDRVAPPSQPLYPEFVSYPEVEVLEDVDYGAGAADIRLDVCLPDDDDSPAGTNATTEAPARAAMLSVHGGSWRQGDKSDIPWRSVCQWFASEGFVTFSMNYRLAPEHPFPAAIDDLREAVRWIRDATQVQRFDLDPARIGAFGGSAGGNLVSLLGLEGEGDHTSGTRVAAVAELSGPIDLTTAGFSLGGVLPDFQKVQLDYLGCSTYSDCPPARAASPLYEVDASDPPFFVGHSVDERIPIEQSDALVERLREAGVSTEYVTVDGSAHSIAMLDDELRDRIITWLRERLAPE